MREKADAGAEGRKREEKRGCGRGEAKKSLEKPKISVAIGAEKGDKARRKLDVPRRNGNFGNQKHETGALKWLTRKQ